MNILLTFVIYFTSQSLAAPVDISVDASPIKHKSRDRNVFASVGAESFEIQEWDDPTCVSSTFINFHGFEAVGNNYHGGCFFIDNGQIMSLHTDDMDGHPDISIPQQFLLHGNPTWTRAAAKAPLKARSVLYTRTEQALDVKQSKILGGVLGSFCALLLVLLAAVLYRLKRTRIRLPVLPIALNVPSLRCDIPSWMRFPVSAISRSNKISFNSDMFVKVSNSTKVSAERTRPPSIKQFHPPIAKRMPHAPRAALHMQRHKKPPPAPLSFGTETETYIAGQSA
ncbi:hypothetical protein AMATHDRAFT_52418, partial [Amanita thiersii Skay4041]